VFSEDWSNRHLLRSKRHVPSPKHQSTKAPCMAPHAHLSLPCLPFLLLFFALPCLTEAFTPTPPTLPSLLALRGAAPFPRRALAAHPRTSMLHVPHIHEPASRPRTSMRSSALLSVAESTGGGGPLGTLEPGASLLGRESFRSYPGSLATDSIAGVGCRVEG